MKRNNSTSIFTNVTLTKLFTKENTKLLNNKNKVL